MILFDRFAAVVCRCDVVNVQERIENYKKFKKNIASVCIYLQSGVN